jgi:hypothetical protein
MGTTKLSSNETAARALPNLPGNVTTGVGTANRQKRSAKPKANDAKSAAELQVLPQPPKLASDSTVIKGKTRHPQET